MKKIKFGTDGWRAIIAEDYTADNVARVAMATAIWLKKKKDVPSVVVGHDCRFGGEMFAELTARVLCQEGLKVLLAKGFVSTPMVSLGTEHFGADQGVVITASHNPPSYNGFKLKGPYGGPTLPEDIAEVEELIPDQHSIPTGSLKDFENAGILEYVDLQALYIGHLKNCFALDAIKASGITLAYDAMYGAGQNVVRDTLPGTELIHCEWNPGFMGRAPEPLEKNTPELAKALAENPQLGLGLCTDGDADRIGMYDGDGHFVDAHHIILLLIHYLVHYKKMTGKVVVAFSVTEKVKRICEHYGLELVVTKIGFKYICGHMIKDDVLLGGEESGGIAIKGHIPERDGIWDGLTIMEFMAKTGKSLKELIQEVYTLVGAFHFERNDLTLPNEQKLQIVENCKAGKYLSFAKYKVERVEDIDGFKFHLGKDSWVMVRPSGTEPVLRVYCEAPSKEEVLDILESAKQELLG